jgi:cation/acetate symporter
MSGTTSEGTGGVFSASSNAAFKQQLNKVYAWYTGGFMIFVVALAILEVICFWPQRSSCTPALGS